MSYCAPPAKAGSLTQEGGSTPRARPERRIAQRREFGYRLLLTPIDESSGEPSVHVVGRDVSARGVGFEHTESLPYRRVRLSAADPRLEEIGLADLEIDVTLRWCRFVGPDLYESGGRVTRSTAPLD